MTHTPPAPGVRRVSKAGFGADLLAWYDREKRDLPWRHTSDAYAIYVSETMLQQTRVETVIPYYRAFLERFPRVSSLAAAPVDDVLEAWSGLGYYRRARNLWLGAREIVARFGGELPREVEALRSLPGVGRYTAGAVASIAFGVRAPVVDGNVARVLCRLLGIEGDPARGETARALWAAADALVPSERPGCHNQALMELGASVCSPERPDCARCPVARHCAARRDGRTSELPVSVKRTRPSTEALVAVVLRRGDEVLAGKRGPRGRYGGLWEPPMFQVSSTAGARRALTAFGVELAGLRLARVGEVRHVLTHRVLEITVVRGEGERAVLDAARSAAADDDPLHAERHGYARLSFRPTRSVLSRSSVLAKKVLAAAGILLSVLVALTLDAALTRGVACAADPGAAAPSASGEPPQADAYRRLARPRGGYARAFSALSVGRGVRFNNPYRLESQLGDTAESLSLTATYFDAALSLSFGAPDGLQHGGSLHFATSLEGVSQQVITPSYLLAYRADQPFLVYGRLGLPVILTPDLNAGGELAAGGGYFFTGGLGVTTELVFDLFYGAATHDASVTTIPVLSLQLGVIADYEVLP